MSRLLRFVLILAAVLFLISVVHEFSTTHASMTQLTGNIKDAQGNPLNGYVVFQLPVPAQDQTTNTLVTPSQIRYNIVNGAIVNGTSIPLYDIATLQPQNLYYQAEFFDAAGTYVMGGNYVITGGSFNLGAAIPTSITTSNISYSSPALLAADQTFTGNNTFTGNVTLDGPVNTIGPSGLIFSGNGSDPAGAAGMYNWRTDLLRFRFFDSAWHTVPGQDTNNSWGGVQTFTSSPPFVVTSSTVVPTLNVEVLNGVTVSGTPAAGNVLTATSPTAAGWGTSTIAIQSFCTPLVMGGNVSGSASLVSVGTVTCTMPSAGCPCRALVNWNVAVTMATNHDVEFWVNDGTNDFRHSHVNGQTADNTGSSQGLVTPVTYANGAMVTFTLETQGVASASYTVVAAAAVGPGAASGMDVSILTSN